MRSRPSISFRVYIISQYIAFNCTTTIVASYLGIRREHHSLDPKKHYETPYFVYNLHQEYNTQIQPKTAGLDDRTRNTKCSQRGKENHEEQCKEPHHTRLPRSMLPRLGIPSRKGSRREELALLILMLLQTQHLPGRSPCLFVLEQLLGLFLVAGTQFMVRLFAGVALGILLVLLVNLPFLGLLPTFLLPAS